VSQILGCTLYKYHYLSILRREKMGIPGFWFT
jgi:hypothetical protein